MMTVRLVFLLLVALVAYYPVCHGEFNQDDDEVGHTSRACGPSSPSCQADDKKDPPTKTENGFVVQPEASIETYLTAKSMATPGWLDKVAGELQAGHLVVIENAFEAEFAEFAYQELAREDLDLEWELHVGQESGGFHSRHHHIFDSEFSDSLLEIYQVFDHPQSKKFLSKLSNRDCAGGEVSASAARYYPGGHSAPHTDYLDDRSIAFIWHLSRDWDPTWGGAFYWVNSHEHNPYVHASFNTLVLFQVNPTSTHLVTPVTFEAPDTSKRLTFGGWYFSDWESSVDFPIEDMTRAEQDALTYSQIERILGTKVEGPERKEKMNTLRTDLKRYIGLNTDETYIESELIHYA